jgi:hypothetical protein
MAQKPSRKFLTPLFVTLLILAIIGYRVVKILDRHAQKQLLAQSVHARIVWDIQIPKDEFVGDLSQIGSGFFYTTHDDDTPTTAHFFVRDLGSAVTMPLPQPYPTPSTPPNPKIIGLSKQGKKEFRIEQENGQTVIAQYNIATQERGLIARLPKDCGDFELVQRLPQNLFALAGLCGLSNDRASRHRRVIVVDFETRRLTFASERFASNVGAFAFTKIR